jgi:TatA/E family protein of Tat protein translocase
MFVSPLLSLGTVGAGEILVIVLLVLLLFGAHKIPELARALGRAQREFQRARDEVVREVESSESSEDQRVRRAAKDLGIAVEGRTTDQLKAAIAERMAGPTPKPAA